jgi:hypothetical protein
MFDKFASFLRATADSLMESAGILYSSADVEEQELRERVTKENASTLLAATCDLMLARNNLLRYISGSDFKKKEMKSLIKWIADPASSPQPADSADLDPIFMELVDNLDGAHSEFVRVGAELFGSGGSI